MGKKFIRGAKIMKPEYDYLKSLMDGGMTPYQASRFAHRSDSTMSYINRTVDYDDYQAFLKRKSISQEIKRKKGRQVEPTGVWEVKKFPEPASKSYKMYDDAVILSLADLTKRLEKLEHVEKTPTASGTWQSSPTFGTAVPRTMNLGTATPIDPHVFEEYKKASLEAERDLEQQIEKYKQRAFVGMVMAIVLLFATVYLVLNS